MMSLPAALMINVILAILSTPISAAARSPTVGIVALVRDAPSQRGCAGLEPGREDPGAMLRGLARYQGTDDAPDAP
jgi:hypothetical protein